MAWIPGGTFRMGSDDFLPEEKVVESVTPDWYSGDRRAMAHQQNPHGPAESESFDPREPNGPKHVIKGGSYLCAKNYCSRYRPAARES